MRVRCLSAAAQTLPSQYLDARAGLHAEYRFDLTRGREYVVYAVWFNGERVWYQLVDDCGLAWPIRFPAPLFEVIDGSVSKYWCYAFTPDHSDHRSGILAPEAWARDAFFYDRLTDGVEAEVATFSRARSDMDQEDFERNGPLRDSSGSDEDPEH